MTCEIEPAGTDDAPALARIAALTLREAWSEVAYREVLARPYGGGLLDAFLGGARREGAVRARLEVCESNAPARALYRGYGFRREGRRYRYYADGEAALLLGAPL